jgi:glutaminyl-tRNA synthetase
MSSPNMLMRDPVLYRIRHAHHFRQGDDWCIYPLYDYAHCLEDAFEHVTHSICTLEFENNRELYDWVLDNVGFDEPRPHQYEWAGLDLENAVLSKRNIKPLVEAGLVSGWDDPRLATIAAYRRRGIPPEALELLSELVGVSRAGARTEEAKLDFAIREVLNASAPRVMAVLDPLRVVLTNFPEGAVEELNAPYYPHDVPLEGSRPVPFTRELYIERSDFAETPPRGFRRLVPGGEVRLRYAYVIRCDEVVKDDDGWVTELLCSYDPESGGGGTSDGRKVKGIAQWVSAAHALDAEVRLFGPLLRPIDEGKEDEVDIAERVDPGSLRVISRAKVEPSVRGDDPDTRYQFERTGYFWRDPVDGRGGELVFNRIVGLKSTYTVHGQADSTSAVARAGATSATGRAAEVATAAEAAKAPGKTEQAKSPGTVEQDASDPVRVVDRAAARGANPELAARFDRYVGELGVSAEHADVLTASIEEADFFEAALAEHGDPATVAAWIVIDLRGIAGDRSPGDMPFGGEGLGRLSALVEAGRVSRRAGKTVLARMVEQGGDPAALVSEMGVERVTDAAALGPIVDGVLGAWPEKVDAYRAGNANLIGLFVGEVMKATAGAADPRAVRALLEERLDR